MSGTAIKPSHEPTPSKSSPLAVSANAKTLAAKMSRKKNPIRAEDLSDQDILTALLGNQKAAKAILSEIGSLAKFTLLADAGVMSRVKLSPAVGAAVIAKLECIFEAAVRISGRV
ncbi:hypothetical protein [Deinococcus roseus]|uniref:Uncharacterized protein n=1 Tax=Deinococcus roseus TaxID=392414 RepID=A0ABQ2DFS6_9DEIO|nr:hypothetical protein [Deinococcus roseus]GGJ56483.1 hypothetical protein GCM10008938_48310 [Deinococcus roseus]